MGIVASLNQPEGNVTGVTFYSGVLGAKGIELLHELAPTATAIGLLVNPRQSGYRGPSKRSASGNSLALETASILLMLSDEREIDPAFAVLEQTHVGALLISGNAVFTGQRDRLVALAARYHLPTMYFLREFVRRAAL